MMRSDLDPPQDVVQIVNLAYVFLYSDTNFVYAVQHNI